MTSGQAAAGSFRGPLLPVAGEVGEGANNLDGGVLLVEQGNGLVGALGAVIVAPPGVVQDGGVLGGAAAGCRRTCRKRRATPLPPHRWRLLVMNFLLLIMRAPSLGDLRGAAMATAN